MRLFLVLERRVADGLRGLGGVAGGKGVVGFGWPLELEKEVRF